eukprot:scaffold45624_cov43-Prasinocladus_malaysianus.AAC.1
MLRTKLCLAPSHTPRKILLALVQQRRGRASRTVIGLEARGTESKIKALYTKGLAQALEFRAIMLDSEAGVGPLCQLKAELEARTLAKTTGASPGSADSSTDSIQPSSSLITPRMRSTLCGWLVEVCQEFGLHQETLFLGISLTDRFLSLQPVRSPGVTKHQLQLVGTACLFIAAKQEE